ncbi:DUF2141 domain-containing protein [Novosphingobium sp. MMS21-SN21R]|uniref:DUF2141 domain-containing protein n=1 Tax=Novosphingobium sp. MMS21-SN21R TaxID=2969298 RepID=UPI00288637AC|nr:DUF2141 domain-containing protein [Novosphingobium sp. MMS21-SN21R]MDT0506385.1 DUF2141 domain-containing protein [Novosphingobium sp. MMS21-SN21R]MDT0509482.1 DUF2141 domain-containing protein [Novosphingobium sp. MMS21-SN21R]
MKPTFRMLLALSPSVLLGNAPGTTTVTIDLTGMRNSTGMIYACMTAKPKAFPKACDADPDRRTASVKASDGRQLVIRDVPAGRYAIAVLHDENGNKKMDMTLFLPKEGYGFSRDAPVKMAPPKFDAAAFDVSAGKPVHMTMKVRYI